METATAMPEAKTSLIDLAQIDVPQDARPHDPDKLALLADDMQKQGQLQEIVVTPTTSDRFEVVAGVGRVQAARKLGWTQIRASVREGLSEFDKARITYAENEDREDADPFYQAAQLDKMMKAKGWTQEQLADFVGQAESNVKIYLALVNVSPAFRDGASRLALTITQLNQLLRLPADQDRIALAQECHSKDLSVRQLKALVDQKLGKTPTKGQATTLPGLSQGEKGKAGGEHDPLMKLWDPLKVQQVTDPYVWDVAFKGPGHWQFDAFLGEEPLADPKKELGQWFLKMAHALGETQIDQALEEQYASRKREAQKITRSFQSALFEAAKKGDIKSPAIDPKIAEMIARRKAQRMLP